MTEYQLSASQNNLLLSRQSRVEPSLRRSWHSRGRGLIRLIIVLKTNYFVCFLYSLNTNRIRGVLNVQGAHAIFLKRWNVLELMIRAASKETLTFYIC